MGRERRRRAAAAATAVQLPEADYWKFRSAINDMCAIELEARQAADAFRERIARVQARTRALFAELGKTHGFDPAKTYSWDDATCRLLEKAST